MNCKHEIEWLMGTKDGLVCRRCGATFKSFLELGHDPATEAKAPVGANTAAKRGRKKKGETDA